MVMLVDDWMVRYLDGQRVRWLNCFMVGWITEKSVTVRQRIIAG